MQSFLSTSLAAALFVTLAVGCHGQVQEDTTPEDPGVASTSEALSTTTGTSFAFTYYWISERPSGDANEVKLNDCNGNLITWSSRSWRDKVHMEMTGRFKDSSGAAITFNDWGGCWKVLGSTYPWGAGTASPYTSKSYRLRPFRSIAVDDSVLKIGHWYYVKELDGKRMPYPVDGLIHDGCVRAVDTSWSFSGKHIDFFVGVEKSYSTLDNGAMNGRTSVTLYDGATKCAEHIQNGY